MLTCDHCRTGFDPTEALHDTIDGQARIFCCRGCRGIYRLICQEGLSGFYSHTGWDGGARVPDSSSPEIDLAHFEGLVKTAKGICGIELYIEGVRCASCIWLNEKILARIPGVQDVTVSYATHRARVHWDPDRTGLAEILERIRAIGYSPVPWSESDQFLRRRRETRNLLFRFGTAGFLSMQIMMLSTALYAGYFQDISVHSKFIFEMTALGLTLPVIFYSGLPFFTHAGRSLKQGQFTMDTLVAAGVGSAFIYSLYALLTGGDVYFDTVAMVVSLFLLGQLIEAGAREKATETVERLLALRPAEARVVGPEGERRKMPIQDVEKGDRVEVLPRERVPLDGIVRDGGSEVDESLITGESKPVRKVAGSSVIGGSINFYGAFILEVTHTGEDTVLAGIVKVVTDAQTSRPKIQTVADRVVSYFVPAILALAFAAVVFHLSRGLAVDKALMIGISVLVIACPCSLGLATPLALMVFTSLASGKGVLIKNPDVIETISRTSHVVFDKTGTITVGSPVLRETIILDRSLKKDEILVYAQALERRSEHIIGRAIAASYSPPPDARWQAETFTAIPGKGVSGRVHGKTIAIGNREMMREAGVSELEIAAGEAKARNCELQGDTVVYVAWDGGLRALLAISDILRKETRAVIGELETLGFDLTLMSGDCETTTRAMARMAGIHSALSRVSPVEKRDRIQALQEQGARILMVGDGINDAAALIQADAGLAMGRGTEIAIESADAVLIRNDLSLLPYILTLSRKTLMIIRQNIFWAFFYNAAAIPLALAGILHPVVAAASMAASSLIVVGNSLRLRNRSSFPATPSAQAPVRTALAAVSSSDHSI